jgi:hypothetical protein
MNMQTVQTKFSRARLSRTPISIALSASEKYPGSRKIMDQQEDEIVLYAGQNPAEPGEQQGEQPTDELKPKPADSGLKVDPIDPDPRLSVGGTTSTVS